MLTRASTLGNRWSQAIDGTLAERGGLSLRWAAPHVLPRGTSWFARSADARPTMSARPIRFWCSRGSSPTVLERLVAKLDARAGFIGLRGRAVRNRAGVRGDAPGRARCWRGRGAARPFAVTPRAVAELSGLVTPVWPSNGATRRPHALRRSRTRVPGVAESVAVAGDGVEDLVRGHPGRVPPPSTSGTIGAISSWQPRPAAGPQPRHARVGLARQRRFPSLSRTMIAGGTINWRAPRPREPAFASGCWS
jgi:hypothetical protein